MNTEVEPVFFDNRDNLRLYGILHRSQDARKDVGIIILSPGIKSRVAPHRLYVKMANRFYEMGFCVLRFDPHGIGDSEGEIEARTTADFYGSVQVGRFVNDTIDAMDWMENAHGISRFILAGLCGGAITGLLTGAIDQRVHSLLGLGIPVILDSAKADQTKYMTRGQLEDLRGSYLKKLLDLKSWTRFLSLKSDYRLIYRSILTAIKGETVQLNTPHPSPPVENEGVRVESNELGNNFNPYFPMALHNMLSSRRVLLIFSEADRLFWEFEEKYMSSYKNEFEKYKNNAEIYITKGANHIFSFKVWQAEMLKASCEWLDKNYKR